MLDFFALGLLILFATSTILGIGTEGHLPIAEAQVQNPFLSPAAPQPQLVDPNLKVELVYTGPGFPTNMAFIGPDDILLLSKNDGKVLRIKDGKNLGPVLEVNVTRKDEMGLLGIATGTIQESKVSHQSFLVLQFVQFQSRMQ